MQETRIFHSHSPDETEKIAKIISLELKKGDVITLQGPLGAGKTTFAKFLISQLCNIDPNEIVSPTFTYMNTYNGAFPLHHYDLYRITDPNQINEMGLFEPLYKNCICLIEWPEKGEGLIHPSMIIQINYANETTRTITIKRKTQ